MNNSRLHRPKTNAMNTHYLFYNLTPAASDLFGFGEGRAYLLFLPGPRGDSAKNERGGPITERDSTRDPCLQMGMHILLSLPIESSGQRTARMVQIQAENARDGDAQRRGTS